jgi:hypothetical protein
VSLNIQESGLAAKVAALGTAAPAEANAPTPTTGRQPERAASGGLGRPGTQALDKVGGRLAELPIVRMRSIVRTSERGATTQMTQGARARLAVPDLRVPQGSAGGTVLRGLFPPGSVVVRTSAARTPPLQGYRPTGESLVAIEAAFTPQRIDAFSALGNEQKLLARSLLADLLPRLQAGAISDAEFNLGVGLVLQAARDYAPPTEAVNQPPAPTATPPARAPVVGDTPQGARAESPVPAQPVAPAGSPPAWSNEKIRDAVNTLAQQRGITRPSFMALMADILQHPCSTGPQRSARLGYSEGSLFSNLTYIRRSLGSSTSKGDLRLELAQLTGMPLATLVARIGTESDPQLGSRVIGRIDPSHREAVALRLLAASAGSKIEIGAYQTLETMFTSDPLSGSVSTAVSSMQFLYGAFGKDRVEILRAMGFGFEEILRMNPVGVELAKRMDPAMGTYSAAEASVRRVKRLPVTREEAAMRLLTAKGPDGKGFSYRVWGALALLSDKPWSMPQDLSNAYLSVSPKGSPIAGQNDASKAFRIAEQLIGRPIPRGAGADMMDRDYRQDINRQLLQIGGLGATGLSTGRLESIPTDFQPRDRPVPNAAQDAREPIAGRESASHPITWQDVLRLLDRPAR